jgi:hypothetical protein
VVFRRCSYFLTKHLVLTYTFIEERTNTKSGDWGTAEKVAYPVFFRMWMLIPNNKSDDRKIVR